MPPTSTPWPSSPTNFSPGVLLLWDDKSRSCTSTLTSSHNPPAPSTHSFPKTLMQSFSKPWPNKLKTVSCPFPPSPTPSRRQHSVLMHLPSSKRHIHRRVAIFRQHWLSAKRHKPCTDTTRRPPGVCTCAGGCLRWPDSSSSGHGRAIQ